MAIRVHVEHLKPQRVTGLLFRSSGHINGQLLQIDGGLTLYLGRSAMSQFVVIVRNRVKPGHEQEYVDLVTPVLDAMRHEKTFINTMLHQDPADPCQFMLYETWTDREDFLRVQMGRAYRKAYESRLPEILERPREMHYWSPIRCDYVFATSGSAVLSQP
jgi:quinol monooxygenase YgiN